jgi:hypothetical protein
MQGVEKYVAPPTTSSFFANNVDAIASAGFRSPSGILRLLATATIEPSYDHLIILSVLSVILSAHLSSAW